MPKFVRVKLETGAEVSVSEAFAKSQHLEVLGKPASRNGKALPAKPRNPVKRADPPTAATDSVETQRTGVKSTADSTPLADKENRS